MPLFRKDRFMQDPIIVDVLTYWEKLRDGRIAPMRSELEPRQIAHAVDHTFVLEYKAPQDVRFRQAGMRLNELIGMELRGMPVRALVDLSNRTLLGETIDALVNDPKIVELHLLGSGHPSITARMLLLPMQNESGQITRILGCLTTQGRVIQLPQRFEISDIKTTRIVGVMSDKSPTQAAGFAEKATPFSGTPKMTRPKPTGSKTKRLGAEKPYLRLVKDD